MSQWKSRVAKGLCGSCGKINPSKAEVDYSPDPVWCIDICKTKSDNFYVLEVGGFSSAGLYGADTDLLVKAVNKVAINEWKEYYT